MEVEYYYWTGTFNTVLESLNRSIAQYIRHHKKVKIGITNDPVRRARQHTKTRHNWDYMKVKYKTSSVNYVNQLERLLIDNYMDYLTNEIRGGGGPKGEGYQYLYVLLKK
ncbi:MAG: GIY-YIG nuclease family protein [Bacteroidota bacterium]